MRVLHLDLVRDQWQLVFHNKELNKSISALLRKGLKASKLLLQSLLRLAQALGANGLLWSKGFEQAFKASFLDKIMQELSKEKGLLMAFDQYHTGSHYI